MGCHLLVFWTMCVFVGALDVSKGVEHVGVAGNPVNLVVSMTGIDKVMKFQKLFQPILRSSSGIVLKAT